MIDLGIFEGHASFVDGLGKHHPLVGHPRETFQGFDPGQQVVIPCRVPRQDDGATLIEMPLSRQDIADMTGATVETVSRVMSDFRRSGLIESGRRWISIRDRDALEDIAQGAVG